MPRRYRKRNKNRLSSVVADVAHMASRLPWWGAFLMGVASYLLIAHGLAGYIESLTAAQKGNLLYPVIESRNGRLVSACRWVGVSCFLVGVFFAVRNYFDHAGAGTSEKGMVAVLAKLLGRTVD